MNPNYYCMMITRQKFELAQNSLKEIWNRYSGYESIQSVSFKLWPMYSTHYTSLSLHTELLYPGIKWHSDCPARFLSLSENSHLIPTRTLFTPVSQSELLLAVDWDPAVMSTVFCFLFCFLFFLTAMFYTGSLVVVLMVQFIHKTQNFRL